MPFQFFWVFLTALFPLLIGLVWYHPAVFGRAWLRASGLNTEQLQGSMWRVFLFAYLLGIFISFVMLPTVIHQVALFQLVAHEPDPLKAASPAAQWLQKGMELFGQHFRSFGHGALHGFQAGLMFAFPVIAITAMFERRSWRYILVHAGYWILTFLLIGGTLCALA